MRHYYSKHTVPLCLRHGALDGGDGLDPTVPLHLLDAEVGVLVRSTLYEAIFSICHIPVRKMDRRTKLPPYPGEPVPQLIGGGETGGVKC